MNDQQGAGGLFSLTAKPTLSKATITSIRDKVDKVLHRSASQGAWKDTLCNLPVLIEPAIVVSTRVCGILLQQMSVSKSMHISTTFTN